jgi:hypothetical protein
VAFDLHVVSNFSFSAVFCPKLGLYVIPLQYRYLFLVYLLIYFISDAVILVASLALMVQFSLLYYTVGGASVWYKFILVSFSVFFDLNILFIKPVIFRYLICYQCPFNSHRIGKILRSSVSTSTKTQLISITKISDYSEGHEKSTNILCVENV